MRRKKIGNLRLKLQSHLIKKGSDTVILCAKILLLVEPLPRAVSAHERLLSCCSTVGKVLGARGTPVKMKPKPAGIEFDEVDVRKILRPNSHSKYIQEPAFDSVVYIARPKGIVPLSTLCPTSETIMPAKPDALAKRNRTYGKPKLFVQDRGRILAIGGSRLKSAVQYESVSQPIRILRPPSLPVVDPEGRVVSKDLQDEFVPFQMSEEYACWAAKALDTTSIDKVDI